MRIVGDRPKGRTWNRLRQRGLTAAIAGLAVFAMACGSAAAPSGGGDGGAASSSGGAAGSAEKPDTERFPQLFPADETSVTRGGTLISAHSFDAAHFDWRYTSNAGVQNIVGNIYEPLTRYAAPKDDAYSYILEGSLADKWEMSTDAKTWTFKLRQGIKWQNLPPLNGRDLVADDVVWTYDEYRKKDSILAGPMANIAGVEAVDKATVKFTLKAADPYFAQNVAGSGTHRWGILPHEIAEKGDLKTTAVGTGPFILTDYVAKSSATLKANPDYWTMGIDGKPLPYLAGYKYLTITEESQRTAGFRTGQVQLLDYGVAHVDTVEDVLKTNPTTKVIRRAALTPGSGGTLNFKLDKKPWSDVRVRRAMSLGVDRKAMIDTIWKGYGGIRYSVPFPLWADKDPGQLDTLYPWYKFDPEQAKKLLTEAGYPNGIKVTTQVPFYRGYGEVYVSMYEQFQADMKKIGVELQPFERDYTAYAAGVYAANFDDIMYSCHCPGASNIAQTLSLQLDSTRNGGSPMKGFKDAKMDDLMQKLQVEADPASQKKLAREIIDYENDQVFRLFMVGADTFQLMAANIHNYRPGAAATGPSFPQLLSRIWMSQ